MIKTRVAVLLSTYNGEEYIEALLESLCFQDFKNFTLFVRDDCSSDNTLSIIDKYKDNLDIKLIYSDENLGAANSFFSLLDVAGNDFDYYAFADQDDVWLSGKIDRAVSKLDLMPSDNALLYCSRLEYVDKNLMHLNWSRVPNNIDFGNALVENIATGCTVVINNAARKLTLSKVPQNCLMHDWWLYLVISCYGTVYWDDYSGIKYRQHGSNVVGAATTFLSDIQRRVDRFLQDDKNGLFSLSDQAAAFFSLFCSDLPNEKLVVLRSIIRGKTSFFERLKLASSFSIWRQRPFDNVLMRIMILINHY
jgi:glycosyltransferase involved in cell wall biosynthesis